MSDTHEILSLDDAKSLVTKAFSANGVPAAVAASVAEALVSAEAEGQVGHGFSRIDDYVAQAKSGKIIADAEPRVSRPATTSILIDAGYGFAYPALDLATKLGAETAAEHGTASVAITHSHHCGALSIQVDRLARQGMVATMVANSPPAIAPWGAKTPLYGTNPIAFAAPRTGKPPLVVDLSLSVVARGKVMNAKKAGKEIPAEWALDADGNPTTDPNAALEGSMQPIGGPKGTSLALMVEVFAAAMTGANLSTNAGSFFTADGSRPGVGQFFTIYKPPHGADVFAEKLEELLAMVEAMEGARLPGSRRIQAMDSAVANGLSVPKHYLETTRRLAGI